MFYILSGLRLLLHRRLQEISLDWINMDPAWPSDRPDLARDLPPGGKHPIFTLFDDGRYIVHSFSLVYLGLKLCKANF